ncbi:MAG TPA: PIN domain-containing protein [Pyrinomonadaceae bacterium]|nr:PIN domain-containing protein [Pyrinomonadaceae bacterium]
MNEKSLFDTGFLLAILNIEDELHKSCVSAYENENRAALPEVVIPELAYLVMRELGYKALSKFLRSVAAGDFTLVPTELPDLNRAAEILEKYADAKVDFVDCVIVAIAERLNIERILTVDRRHFGLFHPAHCEFFEIVP